LNDLSTGTDDVVILEIAKEAELAMRRSTEHGTRAPHRHLRSFASRAEVALFCASR
jgi:hypothetical protein